MQEMPTPQKDLKEFILSKKFSFTPTFDGVLGRFDRGGKFQRGWAIGKLLHVSGKPVKWLQFGDWGTGEKHTWTSREGLTAADLAALEEAAALERKRYEEEKTARQAATKLRASEVWGSLPSFGEPTAYSHKKGLYDLYGARADAQGFLFVPLRDAEGTLWNLQRIAPDGSKRFFKGGRISGLFHTIGDELSPESKVIYVCEGYATGASIWEALQTEEDPMAEVVLPRAEPASLPDGDQPPSDATEPRAPVHEELRPLQGFGRNAHEAFGPLSPFDPIIEYAKDVVARHLFGPTGVGGLDQAQRAGLDEIQNLRRPHAAETPAGRGDPDPRPARVVATDLGPLNARGAPRGVRPPGDARARGPAHAPCAHLQTPQDRSYLRSHDTRQEGDGSRPGHRTPQEVVEPLEQALRGDDLPRVNEREPKDLRRHTPRLSVIVALNAGNLPHVAKVLRQRYKHLEIIICGDDDGRSQAPGVTGEKAPYNPGQVQALLATKLALRGGSARAVFPLFSPHSSRALSDFNDLHVSEGLEAVRACFAPTPTAATDHQEEQKAHEVTLLPAQGPQGALPDLCEGVGAKRKPPTHQTVANFMFERYATHFVKQGRDLFRYTGTHWKHLEEGEHDLLKMEIQALCGELARVDQLDAIFRLFVIMLPGPPEGVDMFTPNPLCANFLDGTLHVRKIKREYTTEFKPHEAADFLINVIPLEYLKADSDNQEFLGMLERVFDGDADKDQKIRAVGQMYGACLLPLFPRLFMLIGAAGTGKSTVIKIAARLIHPDNISRVEPHAFTGFNLESMAGKLVNLDTDITVTEPIADAMIKKIEDRQPFRIARKNIKDIYAPLPAVHIFGGNSMPQTREGATGAHTRRWTFIGFDRVLVNGVFDKEYHDYCYEQNPHGILKFALVGLKDLLSLKGHFTQPDSGVEKLEEWQTERDLVELFLKDIKEGVVLDNNSVVLESFDHRIPTVKFFEIFKNWLSESSPRTATIGRNLFLKRLKAKGFTPKPVEGKYFIKGFSIHASGTSHH